jgi:glyoxylase-like metal-dependent hydrolase (beta-lactamase superfamily II)
MRRTALLSVVMLSLVGMATTNFASKANSAASKAEDDFQLVKVADGIYAAIAKPGGLASGNAGFIVGDGGVMIVDTFFTPAAVEELISEIATQTKQPIKYAVNTHYHLDHTGGNQVLAARNIPIFAHARSMGWQATKNRRFLPERVELDKRRSDVAKQLEAVPADQPDKRAPLERQLRRLDAMRQIKLTPPSILFEVGSLHVYLGNREVILLTLPGHTGGDVLVYVPDANVIFTGDMGWSRTLPNLVDATVIDWIKSLDVLLEQHAGAKFIPGHGEVATRVEMREFRDYLDGLRRTVQLAIDDGLTIEQAKEQFKLPDRYKSFAFQNFAQPNIEDMYKELKGTKNTN